jgi:hypothetical protein
MFPAGFTEIKYSGKVGGPLHILDKIKSISDLNQMTDAFLEQLVKESLVEPLAIHFERWTKKLRTETLGLLIGQ